MLFKRMVRAQAAAAAERACGPLSWPLSIYLYVYTLLRASIPSCRRFGGEDACVMCMLCEHRFVALSCLFLGSRVLTLLGTVCERRSTRSRRRTRPRPVRPREAMDMVMASGLSTST